MAEEQPPTSNDAAGEDNPAAVPTSESTVTDESAAPAASVDALSADPIAAAIANDPSSDQTTSAAEIEELLKQANFEDPTAMVGAVAAPEASEFKLPNIQQVMQDAQVSSIDLLRDVELNVKIELGRSRMLVEDVLKLAEGSVVELDKLAGDPVDVFVNDRLVARGEVLVLNDNFCVRVNEIVAGVKEEGT